MADSELDLKEAIKKTQNFTVATGVNTFLIDAEGEYLYRTEDEPCLLCRHLHAIKNDAMPCSDVHLYGTYQAERFGGSYIYFCPIGLTYFAAPIILQGFRAGALIGGPVLMVDPEDFFDEDIVKNQDLPEEYKQELLSYARQISFREPKTVTALADLLFAAAGVLSDISVHKFFTDKEIIEDQAKISETIHEIKEHPFRENASGGYPLDKERALLAAISRGDRDGARELMNEVLGYVFFSTGRNLELVKPRVLELIVLLSRAAMEGGGDAEEIFGLNFGYIRAIDRMDSIESLAAWLSRILVRFSDCVFNLKNIKHVDVIYKSLDFIKKNYMQKISLSDVASYAYLSPSYFSKIFKEEMKCNFNAYLNKIRVDMSKEKLLDDSLSLAEVALDCGFEDQSYFTKVFKKNTGVSPGKYREIRGQLS